MELIPITEETLSPVSLKVNGEWLEIAIPQAFSEKYGEGKWCYFLTTSVSGREDDQVNINSQDLPQDGARYYGRRRPAKTLTISFYIESDSKENAILAYELLKGCLNKPESVQIIFADDKNRYFEAVYGGATYSGRGYNGSSTGIAGQFTYFCKDPHKYSTVVKSFMSSYNATDGTMNLEIQNGGTLPVPISYNVKFSKNSGYIAFAADNAVLQFGDSEETATSGSRQIVSYTGESLVAAINDSSNTKVFDLSNIADSSNANYYFSEHFHTKDGKFVVDPTPDKYLSIDPNTLSKGINANTGWYGAGLAIDVRQTDIPIKNFKVEFQPWFETFKDASQLGLMQILVVNKPTDNDQATIIAGFQFLKSDKANNKARIYFKVGYKSGSTPTVNDYNDSYSYTPSYESKFVANGPSGYFSKDGSTFKFQLGNLTKELSMSQYSSGGVNENLEATHLVVLIANKTKYSKWVGRYPISGDENSNYPRMRLNNISMTQTDSISTTFTVDNTYKSGDVMFVDGEEGTVLVNGANRVSDEKIGSEYFLAEPGTNNVSILLSNFENSSSAPATVTASIREGWL